MVNMSEIDNITNTLISNWQQPSDPKMKGISDILLYVTPILIPFAESSLPSIIGTRCTNMALFSYVVSVIIFKAMVKAFTINNKK
jgi:hypothetical protein